MTTEQVRLPSNSVRDALIWLQEQMTELRDLATRLQQDNTQTLGTMAGLTERLDELHDRLSRLDRDRGAMPRVQQELGETRELASQLEARLAAAIVQAAEGERQRQFDIERERQARTELARRLDVLYQATATVDQRFNVIEEAQQQQREVASALRHDTDETRAAARALLGRETAISEVVRRLELRLSALDSQISEVDRRVGVLDERVQTAIDITRRLDMQIADLARGLSAIEEVREQVEVVRAERARFETRVQASEVRQDRMEESLAEQASVAARVLGRFQGIDERLSQLQADVSGLNETVVNQLLRFGQTLERQRRRQIGDLEREIRELKQHATRISEE